MNTKKTKKSPVAAVCSALGTALLILLIVICLPLTVPKAFHYHVYTVISGSMEPAIPTGSLVYIKEMEPKDVQVDDVIAFYVTKDAATIITHRDVENRVAYSIPKVGGIALVLTGVYGKILAGGAILGAVILHGIASVINSKREKDEDEAEHLSEKKE